VSSRVLVTGGAGFIGSHLVDSLVADGDEVSVLDDFSRGNRAWVHPDTDVHVLDIRDATAVEAAVSAIEPDVVVHLAALHFIPAVEDAPRFARDINVTGTRCLLDALARRTPELLIFASTAAVYPDRAGPIDEACIPGPIDLYGRTKLEGERVVAEYGERTGARTVIARLFNVVGPRETNPHVVPEVIGQLLRGASRVRVGNLAPRRDYSDVRDVADALRRLTTVGGEVSGVFNIGSGRSVSVTDIVAECASILGKPIETEVDRSRVRARDRAELVADARRLREATEWRPAWSLRETLEELLAERA
jgi:UDP-glucose 4-epimerase